MVYLFFLLSILPSVKVSPFLYLEQLNHLLAFNFTIGVTNFGKDGLEFLVADTALGPDIVKDTLQTRRDNLLVHRGGPNNVFFEANGKFLRVTV